MRDRLLRDVFIAVALVLVGFRLLSIAPWDQSVDAFAYWSTRSGDLYAGSTGGIGAYLYSPAYAQVISPITGLAWPIFNAIWTGLGCYLLWWMAGRWALLTLLFLPIPFEIISGNVHLLFAAVIVVGFRASPAWAIILLTKVTPGVGLVWFLVRREWRALAWTGLSTIAVVAVSYLAAPNLWQDWFKLLSADAGRPLVSVGWFVPIPLLPRLIVALLVVAWGGLTDRYWTVPIAVTIALPVLWLNGLAVLVAILPMMEAKRARPEGETGQESGAAHLIRSRIAHA